MSARERPHILIVGGGYVGMYTALRLQRDLRRTEASITLVAPVSYMTYQPFLPEAAAGNLEPRHVVVPLRPVLRRVQILNGEITGISHARHLATFAPDVGEPVELSYDILVVAVGSVARTLPIPGLAEQGIAFRSVAEAIYLRNHVLSRLDEASSIADPAIRRRLLTFVFVGGGYAGVEALGELEDMARDACQFYPGIDPTDLRWVLVEASHRILPEVSEDLGQYTVRELEGRRIEVRLNTRLTSATNQHMVLSDGDEFDAATLVWTAGVRPHPMLARTDLPLDEKGRVRATAELAVVGQGDAWVAGDCAAVPDLSKGEGAMTSPSAQHAVRQAKRLADNIVATLRGGRLAPYVHAYSGSVASLGLYKGWRRSTASNCAASPPGLCTARTTCGVCRLSTVKSMSWPTGRSRCYSGVRLSRSVRCITRARTSSAPHDRHEEVVRERTDGCSSCEGRVRLAVQPHGSNGSLAACLVGRSRCD